jgi:hypothetical protein
MKCIAYTRQDGGISVVYPTQEFQDKIEMIADKDVPSGLYYKILNISDLPQRESRSAWELYLDASNSDGIGLTKEEFEAKYPEYKGMAVQ